MARRARRTNPLSHIGWDQGLTAINFSRMSPDSGRAMCRQAARIDDQLAAKCEALRATAAGDYRTAAAAYRGSVGPAPRGRDLAYLAQRLVEARDTAGVREALRLAVQRARTEYVLEDAIAEAFLGLGDREKAIEWWVKGDASNVANLDLLVVSPLYAPIRSDPRIQAIIERIKQP